MALLYGKITYIHSHVINYGMYNALISIWYLCVLQMLSNLNKRWTNQRKISLSPPLQERCHLSGSQVVACQRGTYMIMRGNWQLSSLLIREGSYCVSGLTPGLTVYTFIPKHIHSNITHKRPIRHMALLSTENTKNSTCQRSSNKL